MRLNGCLGGVLWRLKMISGGSKQPYFTWYPGYAANTPPSSSSAPSTATHSQNAFLVNLFDFSFVTGCFQAPFRPLTLFQAVPCPASNPKCYCFGR